MILIDMDPTVDTPPAAAAWIDDPGRDGLRRPNAVVYFPRVVMSDPLDENRTLSFANSGVIAGMWARTDAARGVWKAPAGFEAGLAGVQSLASTLTDDENEVLNSRGINCLRGFPQVGPVSWGARTMARDAEWRYLPVRRLALFIEQSIIDGLGFAASEPNDEPLWARIRQDVSSFLHGIFRQGAFQGASPEEAFFVGCGRDTATQVDRGLVTVLVGFAPTKPAEFIIIKIKQRTK